MDESKESRKAMDYVNSIQKSSEMYATPLNYWVSELRKQTVIKNSKKKPKSKSSARTEPPTIEHNEYVVANGEE